MSCAKTDGESVAGTAEVQVSVSSTPITTTLVGLTLGAKTTMLGAEHAFEKHIGQRVRPSKDRFTGARCLTLTPKEGMFSFGGADWTSAEVSVSRQDTITAIAVVYAPEGASVADQQYKTLKKSLKSKYGKGNAMFMQEDGEGCYWTDRLTTVVLTREPGRCRLSYTIDPLDKDL